MKAGQTREEFPEAGRPLCQEQSCGWSYLCIALSEHRGPLAVIATSAARALRSPWHPPTLFSVVERPVRLQIRSVAETGALTSQRKRCILSSPVNAALPSVPVAATVSDWGLEPQGNGRGCHWHGSQLEASSSSVVCLHGRGHVPAPCAFDSRNPSSSFAQDKGPGLFSAEVSSGVRNGYCHTSSCL